MKKRILKIISAIISAAVLFTCGMIPANASYDFISHGVPKNREELEALKEYIRKCHNRDSYFKQVIKSYYDTYKDADRTIYKLK